MKNNLIRQCLKLYNKRVHRMGALQSEEKIIKLTIVGENDWD